MPPLEPGEPWPARSHRPDLRSQRSEWRAIRRWPLGPVAPKEACKPAGPGFTVNVNVHPRRTRLVRQRLQLRQWAVRVKVCRGPLNPLVAQPRQRGDHLLLWHLCVAQSGQKTPASTALPCLLPPTRPTRRCWSGCPAAPSARHISHADVGSESRHRWPVAWSRRYTRRRRG